MTGLGSGMQARHAVIAAQFERSTCFVHQVAHYVHVTFLARQVDRRRAAVHLVIYVPANRRRLVSIRIQFELEVDGKPVGKWLRPAGRTHAQADGQSKNFMPPVHV